jgi:hypothetical protein
MIDKIGKVWRESDQLESTKDHNLFTLISHLCVLINNKLHFHKNHNDFDVHYEIKPKMVVDDEDLLNAVSRMLTMQGCIDATQRLAFAVMGFEYSALGLILPLLDESYALFAGTTQILAKLLSSGKMKRVITAICEQYDLQMTSVRISFYVNAFYILLIGCPFPLLSFFVYS